MTLNFSGFTNPRTGQRLPSTLLQVWGGDENISSTYYLSPQHRSRQLKLAGLRDGAGLAGEGEGVLADQEARALPQVQPEEAGREWARGEWWGVSSSDLSHNWSRSDAASVEEEGVEFVSCLEVIEIWQQISNLSYFKKTTDIDWQNISRSQLFAPIPFDNNFDLCWISPSHWGPHWLVPN